LVVGDNVWSAVLLQGEIEGTKFSLRKCIRPLSGGFPPGHDDDPRVLVLLNRSATENHLSPQVFLHAV
jgi:hypothetical protein